MQERIILLALHPLAIGGRRLLAGLFARLFLDAAQLDGLLRLLDRTVEIPLGLRCLGIGMSLGGVDIEQVGIVVGIALLHLFQSLLVVGVAVEIDVVARDERLIFAGSGVVFAQRA